MSKACQFSAGLLISLVSFAGAAELPTSLVKMKSGECAFTVVQADGVKTAKGIKISITPVDEKQVQALKTTITDKAGKCSLGVVEDGRFILAVNDVNVAILETAETFSLAHYRLVLPSSGLIVGGQAAAEKKDDDDDKGAVIIGGAAAGGAAAGVTAAGLTTAVVLGGAIILIAEESDSSSSDSTGAQASDSVPQTSTASKPSSKAKRPAAPAQTSP
jgi:5-hydroxyisourate hydrolase-like protein (transthyretin family)